MLKFIQKHKNLILIIALILFALFLRTFQLSSIPNGLYPDEAVNATDGLRAFENGDISLYYPNNNGREGLFINLLGLSSSLFGITVFSIRIIPALIGTLTILFAYLLGKEMYSKRFGFILAFLMAVSFWHLNFSRIVFRAIFVPLILTASFYYLFRFYNQIKAFDFQKLFKLDLKELVRKFWKNLLISGLIFGVGFHTYIAFRIAPAIIIVFFGLLLIAFCYHLRVKQKITRFAKRIKTALKPLITFALIFLVGVVVTSAPIFIFFMTNPDSLGARQNDNSISVLDPKNHPNGLVQEITKTFGITMGQFVYQGDNNWRHNLPPNTELSPFVLFLFIAGFLFLAANFILSLLKMLLIVLKKIPLKPPKNPKQKLIKLLSKIENPKEILLKSGFILSFFLIMLSPAFLTVEGLPHALRSIGSLPAAYLIAVLPIMFLLDQNRCLINDKLKKHNLQKFCPIFQKTKQTVVYLGLIFTFLFNFISYFFVWGPSVEASHAFEKRLLNIGEYLQEIQTDPEAEELRNTVKYVVVNLDSKTINTGFPVSLETIRFLNFKNDQNIVYLHPKELNQIDQSEDYLIILQAYDGELVRQIKDRFKVREEKINLSPLQEGNEFYVFWKG
jgi:hypothetical protein